MGKYLVRRLVAMALTVVGVNSVLFFLIRLAPGDPATMLVSENLTGEQIESVRSSWGLDDSTLVQYGRYVENMVTLDFGVSFKQGAPVMSVLGDALANSLLLMLPALVLMTAIGLVIGAFAGWKRGSVFEKVSVFGALVGRGMPTFFVGLVLLMVFAYQRTWFPPGGMTAPGEIGSTWSMLVSADFWHHWVLPGMAIVLTGIYGPLLLMRTSIIEFRGEDFVEVLEAKGLPQRRIVRHAARNGVLPVLTATAITFAFIIDGQVVIEQVFSWPGAGRMVIQSMQDRDYPVLQAVFFVSTIAVVIANLVADLLTAWFDPRVRYA